MHLLSSIFQLSDQLLEVVDAILTEKDLRVFVVIDSIVDLLVELADGGDQRVKLSTESLQLLMKFLLLGEHLVDLRLLDLALSNLIQRLNDEVEVVTCAHQLILDVFCLRSQLVGLVHLLLNLLHEGLLLLVAN